MPSLKNPQIPDDIDPELAVKRLVQVCMQTQMHVTCPDFLRIISISDPHECFRQLCALVNTERLDVQKIIRSANGKIN
ncbi:hypothetical protein KKA33_01560 [Patescibacteria group bacterium]|nr:hypothetical protein [Patescibacteria group bacterium]